MQQEISRRSNRERSDTTRAAILDAARGLFVTRGYADTSTPDIVAAAGLTRGALYHHFEDKKALFRAVAEREAIAVATSIEQATSGDLSARQALKVGARAYFDAMREPGRIRLLLLDGPAVLGKLEMMAIDAANAQRTLEEGIAEAMAPATVSAERLSAMASLLSAAFDRAALDIADGASSEVYVETIGTLIDRMVST
ncbi:TetR/AcrR family transcriptional regulator [Ensifer sp. ENS07]|jgi:AcrR family transcriptional regulator|uniref:TetR/AcrR family transcriptional regulator n=1 Tax=Ensifer adhaerens TaxID=106592 RepID=A0A9Q8Y8R3_ENSAD|nr:MULTISPECIES: TetR/AcrR family transcriptional regulator [Ensifer]MBD9592756.1 TetR/AcrR family transcriptional regulator [Ensifer sp. ENS05]MBD9637628.1 TetR/AcrR family transcriptional regulator [Ensifer sp. ENS07]USJ23164.1 TetR/AcrR family transcriptional regulator [Ensifer adhaerens]UTV36494.1 TetR/AcrR family transcriptional regulator [Ensifer adhaerens]SDM22198.1 transcriptional regulator, TetR family [Ensifer sp. YR511]